MLTDLDYYFYTLQHYKLRETSFINKYGKTKKSLKKKPQYK